MKYRIIKKKNVYRIERKELVKGWVTLTTKRLARGEDWEEPLEFDSLQEAQREVQSRQTAVWKVVG